MTTDVHLVLVSESRRPGEVDLFASYFKRHADFWNIASRLLGLRISAVSVDDAVKTAESLEKQASTVVWCDLPPLPVAQHTQLCESMWGKGLTVLPSAQNYARTWDLSHWYPRLQAAFVRQPPTAIVETTADFSDPRVVTELDNSLLAFSALERAVRTTEPLGGMKKGEGAREILRPWFGWSPLFDLDGMAPWEVAAAGSLRRLGPFLIQQQENWDLQIGGIALQYLPPHLPDIPALRVYVIGGAPVWWSARNRGLKGKAAEGYRLWEDDREAEPKIVSMLVEIASAISKALGATEFVFETASVPQPYIVDVRPINAVLEPSNGAHMASTICLAAWLRGIAQGESTVGALSHLPSYDTIAASVRAAGHKLTGHGPFHLGAAGAVIKPPVEAARGGG
ncbi:MAG: hypothetical protein AB7S36_18825, partial [Planctomycetota bacterium]